MGMTEKLLPEEKNIEPKPKLVSIQRIVGTLLFPEETFKDINIHPNVILPLVIAIVISFTCSLIVSNRININWEQFYTKYFDQQLEKQGKTRTDLSQQEKENLNSQIKAAAKVAPYFTYISPIVFPVVIPPLLALIFWGGITLMGGITTYKKIFSLVIHVFCTVTLFVQGALSVIVVFIKDPADIDITKGAIVVTNLGALMAQGSSKFLVAVLSQLDIFVFWPLILFAIGIPTVSRNISRAYANIVVFGLWAIYAVVAVTLKMIFS